MRVALSNASAKWGGLHEVTDMLATGLAARGHDVVLLCRPGSMLEARMAGRVPLEPVLRGGDFNPRTLWRARAALRRHRSEVVVVLTEKDLRLTGAAAHLAGLPVLARRANYDPLRPGVHGALYYRWFADAVVTASQATRTTLLRSAPVLEAKPFHVIPNALPPEPASVDPPWSVPAGAVVFLFVGRMEDTKGVLDLLTAWARVRAAAPDVHLVWLGKGPLEDVVRSAADTDERMHFVGYRQDAAALMRHADVVVMPSHGEGFGMVAVEAMRAGAAFLGANVGAIPEVVRDGVDGILVEPRAPDALADAMIALAGDSGLRARLSSAAQRRVVTDFAAEVMIDRWESVLAEYVRTD